jgi:ectoine hydroxylase-related dioxygenase (phytanoyl-CoA dioxygenase family)
MESIQIKPRIIRASGRQRVFSALTRRVPKGSVVKPLKPLKSLERSIRSGRAKSPRTPVAVPLLREDLPSVDVIEFHEQLLPGVLAGERGRLASRAARDLGPLVLTVGTRSWTYRSTDDGFEVVEGGVGDPYAAVTMGNLAWSDLASSLRSIGAMFYQNADVFMITTGTLYELGRWEPVLRALYSGVPPYDPARVSLVEIDGTPMDLARRFTLEDDDEELKRWLHTAGYLHLTGVLTAAEVAELQSETQRLSDTVSVDDPNLWWGTYSDGTKVLCRIEYAHQRSPFVEMLARDERLARLARLAGESVVNFLDRLEGPHVIMKPPGELAGMSNLLWHLDSWYDAPAITSPSVTLGIQITGASSESGRMEVIAGSSGQSFSPAIKPEEMEGWPKVALDTQPGDVTVHLSDLFHASPPPSGSGGRATLYMRCYPDSAADFVGPGEMVRDMLMRRNQRSGAKT